ncbi:MAG: radical SAM protein [Candidatus Aenigmatarchaeota archaeon]
MKIREIKCKSLLNKSQLADYCINCYLGCEHACKYCYADYLTKKFVFHEEDWGSFVDVKINAPEILRREVLKKKKGKVFLSSLTDPYQPLEKKYELTRKCLEILLRHQFPIIIQTKSALVSRDVDLLKKFKRCEVGFTITTLDENVRKIFEPNSSPVEEKLQAIEFLKKNGISVYVFLGPILPHLSDFDLEKYFEKMAELKVDGVWVDKLNLKPGIWRRLNEVLKKRYPELLSEWEKILFSRSSYWDEVRKKIREMSKIKGVECVFCY